MANANYSSPAPTQSDLNGLISHVAQTVAHNHLSRHLEPDELNEIQVQCKHLILSIRESLSEKHKQGFTPPALAAAWGVSRNKILNWIRTGELEAINITKDQNGRPRYIVTQQAVESFTRRRSTVQNVATPTRKLQVLADDEIEFF